jgi:hypothetical protein
MKKKDISGVIEGCNEEDNSLGYLGFDSFIPENAKSLYLGYNELLALAGEGFQLFPYHLINPNPGKGWHLNIPNVPLVFVFTCPRSVITRDGRIYVNALALTEDKRYYLDAYMPLIIEDCTRIFNDGIEPEKLSKERVF